MKELYLFPDFNSDIQEVESHDAKERWQYLKSKNFGLEYCQSAMFCGKYGIPLISAYTHDLPENFITFSEIKSKVSDFHQGVTCSDYDYELEKLWVAPSKYVDRLKKFHCFASPDFSLKVGDPLIVQIANTFRNHAIAYYMQEHSVKVLPNMCWSNTQSFEFCFDGYTKGGAVMVSTIGTLGDERSRKYFQLGFMEMLKRVSPDAVVLYGDVNKELMSWMPSQLHIHHVEHKRFKRARRNGK